MNDKDYYKNSLFLASNHRCFVRETVIAVVKIILATIWAQGLSILIWNIATYAVSSSVLSETLYSKDAPNLTTAFTIAGIFIALIQLFYMGYIISTLGKLAEMHKTLTEEEDEINGGERV